MKKNTITIAEFKKLTVRSVDSPPFGKFMIGDAESRKKQQENIAVGDTVFYLECADGGEYTGIGRGDPPIPQVDVSIEQATLV